MFGKFFKKKEDNINNSILIAALLVHAAKIDDNYTIKEKEIIKKALIDLKLTEANKSEELLVKAETKEQDANQKEKAAVWELEDVRKLKDAKIAELENEKGFISAKRYKSNTEKDNYVSISTWKDKKSVERWHQNKKHQLSQNKGKAQIFKSFRIRVAEVYKDYNFS